MKTQKNARERLIRYSILVAVMCVLTFFCSTTIHATVSSKANVDHVEGTSEAKTQDPDSPQDFQFNISSNGIILIPHLYNLDILIRCDLICLNHFYIPDPALYAAIFCDPFGGIKGCKQNQNKNNQNNNEL